MSTAATRAFAIVAGGGTAGHVLPAIAVAEALVEAGHRPDEIHYMGAIRGIETRLLPETPFPHTFLDVVGVQRGLSRREVSNNLRFLPKLIAARRRAIRMFGEMRPRVVVSVGGYASLPAVLAARRVKVPVVVVSYDRFPGRASAAAARRAAACAVAFEDSPLPRATVTGAPVRRDLLGVDRTADRQAARRALGLPEDRFVVAVTGGSQGSGALNGAVASYVASHRDDHGLAVRHVVGERFLDGAGLGFDGRDGVLHQVIGYESDMASVYAAADVLVGRGGASTVHEVAVTGTPAVLVPWAAAAEDHQTANVRWLADRGAVELLPEAELERLGALLDELRADAPRRAALGRAAHELGELHRGGALAGLVESVALA